MKKINEILFLFFNLKKLKVELVVLLDVLCLPVYMCIVCLCSTCGGQKRAPHSREWESQVFLHYHVGARYQIWVLCKSNQSP